VEVATYGVRDVVVLSLSDDQSCDTVGSVSQMPPDLQNVSAEQKLTVGLVVDSGQASNL